MSLKINVKSGERILINGSVIVNAGRDTSLVFETPTKFLLERDVMPMQEANSPAKRIYFILQMLYIFPEDNERLVLFEKLLTSFVTAAPSGLVIAKEMAEQVSQKQFFKALKMGRKLIELEAERLEIWTKT
ncbi:MAG: flagellar biosynthesis repressor FlbT [Alphaproteobacteria bacterium]